ncbi:MAG: hypothetical protein Q9164_005070 [Protoblastenia rupestris]
MIIRYAVSGRFRPRYDIYSYIRNKQLEMNMVDDLHCLLGSPVIAHNVEKPFRMALTNRQLYAETAPILLSSTNFFFDTYDLLYNFFENAPASILERVQNIELLLCPDMLWELRDKDKRYHTPEVHALNAKLRTIPCIHIYAGPVGKDDHDDICFVKGWDPRSVSTQREHNQRLFRLARKLLKSFAHVEFDGYIEEKQRREWMKTWEGDRKTIYGEETSS